VSREDFYEPDKIFEEVQKHLKKLAEKPDYLTFVANGEPTLDKNLGRSIQKLKELDIPVAVITNASLLGDPQVQDDLCLADWVSVKVDANDETVWHKINRPFHSLGFKYHKDGILQFASKYNGKLVTETMLVKGINDHPEILRKNASLIREINPSVAYISVPTRPPALSSVEKPDEEAITEAYQIYTEAGLTVELLLGFEGVNTGYTGNAIEDIVNICTVHPIREDTMQELLKKDHADPVTLDILLNGNYIKKVRYNENSFYVRQFNL
jgi:wyosine [tRNA(Phe)-imidazoG37] synthetase (radical SAM superfamily)